VRNQVSHKYVAQLEEYVTNVKQAIIDCFKPNPIPCDGVLLVPADRYNKLVDAVNAKLSRPVESSTLEQVGKEPIAWIYDWFDETGNVIKDWTTTRKSELKAMVANSGAHNIRALDIRKPFESCKIHGPGQPNAWACPECLRELREENKILKTGIKAVRDLMDSSEGVAGLHLNGDVAPWEEISEGGRFEEHLLAFNEAEKLLGDRK
jgi:hypothetical protein